MNVNISEISKVGSLAFDDEIKEIQSKYSIDSITLKKYLAEDSSQRHVAELLFSLWPSRGKDTSRCLVIGAGRGGLSLNLSKNGFEVDSLEPYAPYNEIISYKYKKNKIAGCVIKSPIESANLDKDRYVFAAMIDVVEHVESPRTSLEIIFSSLLNGGRLYITVPTRFQFFDPHYKLPFICWMPMSLADRLLSAFGLIKEDGGAGRQKLSTMHYFTFEDFEELASSIGFEVVDVRRMQILHPESFTFQGDRFSKIAATMKNLKLSWLLAFLGRRFIGHRLLLVKPT